MHSYFLNVSLAMKIALKEILFVETTYFATVHFCSYAVTVFSMRGGHSVLAQGAMGIRIAEA